MAGRLQQLVAFQNTFRQVARRAEDRLAPLAEAKAFPNGGRLLEPGSTPRSLHSLAMLVR